jgi:hypothetical protein
MLPQDAITDSPQTIASTPSPSVQNDPLLTQVRVAQEESNHAPSEGSSPSSQSDHFPFLSKFIHRREQTQADLWVRDLELMYVLPATIYIGFKD